MQKYAFDIGEKFVVAIVYLINFVSNMHENTPWAFQKMWLEIVFHYWGQIFPHNNNLVHWLET